ncbi:hypothetical protein DFH07DRAFT_991174 [Mycena maculata]|uniref:F-box domain-containing protein n=1 Tax=Mycena maculata TaxID=230809 RepID=A0AAD7JVM4_9AGAR|nr:hypothetical protein DFH07DRAFT_991174 [Mycena maculata]
MASLHLPRDRIAMASFHNLHFLELSLRDWSFTEIHACLYPFPDIQDLTLTCVPMHYLRRRLPNLRRYTGPCVLISHAAPQDIMISSGFALDLRTHWWRGSIISLWVSIKYRNLSGPPLSDVLAFFPNLVTLTVHIYLGKQPAGQDPTTILPAPEVRACEVLEQLRQLLKVRKGLERVVLN